MAYGIIYGLYDPRTEELRYLGQTIHGLSKRISNHMSPSGLRKKLPVACWLRKLSMENCVPLVRVLAEVESRDALDALEVFLIEEAKRLNFKLLNLASGGRVNAGMKRSTACRKRLAEINTGKTVPLEVRNKISRTLSGKRFSADHRMRIGAASKGRKLSLKTREKMSMLQKKHRSTGFDMKYLQRRHAEGIAQTQIAKEMGVSQTCISRRLKQINKSR